MNNLRKRIVVIENDQKFKELLCGLIESTGTYLLTNTYSTCELASAQIKRDFPDVIVMGLEFPEMKGTDCISELKNILPHTNILVVSDYEDEEIVIESFMAGANGYLLKKSCLPKFTEYLSEFSTGGSPLSPFIAKILVDSIHRAQVCPLTPREIQVLKLITQGNTYSAIAQELNISKETSKTHIRNIYKKLNVRSKAEVIRLAFKEHFVPYVSVKAA